MDGPCSHWVFSRLNLLDLSDSFATSETLMSARVRFASMRCTAVFAIISIRETLMSARVRFASMLRTAVSGLRSHFNSRHNAICRRIHNIRRDADASSCALCK